MPQKTPQSQTELALFAPVELIPQGGGQYLLKPGKPVEWLSVAKFATLVGVSPSTVRRYIHQGFIEREQVSSMRHTWRIRSEAVEALRMKFTALRLDGLCVCGAPTTAGTSRCPKCDSVWSTTCAPIS